MLLFLLSHVLWAQTSLFDADCGDLEHIPNGAPPVHLGYSNIRIRASANGFRLYVNEDDGRIERQVPLTWEPNYQRHVARFANGEVWQASLDDGGRLTVRISNMFARCVSTAIARDPFDGTPYDPDQVWRAVRAVGEGCGTGLAPNQR